MVAGACFSQVSIHAPARGATVGLAGGVAIDIGFDPRSRTGSDASVIVRILLWVGFDPRSRTGSDVSSFVGRLPFIRFRSTLPHGERRRPCRILLAACRFDPRSRTGSDREPSSRPCRPWCFDPRSRTGSDMRPFWTSTPQVTFRSTLPHGERLVPAGAADIRVAVSIHAPARGATPGHCRAGSACFRFDPRSRTGSDSGLVPLCSSTAAFRSTLPHGERRPRGAAAGLSSSFDPRSRTGSDYCSAHSDRQHGSFDPRSRTGSDWRPADNRRRPGWFRSTLPHGERRCSCAIAPASRSFRSTLPHGERPEWTTFPAGGGGFDPRSRTGSDSHASARGSVTSGFRSTLPHGERLAHRGSS